MSQQPNSPDTVHLEDEVAEYSSSKKRAKRESCVPNENNYTFDEDNCCSICFEQFTNSGSHRLACLKCGHLFGRSCIKKWLGRGTGSAKRNCPQCKAAAKTTDIRNHYCKGVKVVDTSEKEALQKELQQEKEGKRQMMIELATLRQKCDSLNREIDKMKIEFEKKKSDNITLAQSTNVEYSAASTSASVDQQQSPKAFKVNFVRKFEVCHEGESRVMTFCPRLDCLVASARQNTALFNHSGLKKVDMHNLRCTDFIPIHREVVRDVKFRNLNVLTASFDKTLCLSSVQNNCVIKRWNVGQKVWSCCFNDDQPNYVFCGTQSGRVLAYDVRACDENARDDAAPALELANFERPIFGLHWLRSFGHSGTSGLLACSLDKCAFLAQESSVDFTPHILSTDGRLYSVSFESDHLLISYGPSTNRRLTTEHTVYQLSRSSLGGTDQETSANPVQLYTCNQISSLKGGAKQTLMCRNLLRKHPVDSNQLLACTYEESINAIQMWNVSGGGVQARIPLNNNETVYDMAMFSVNDKLFNTVLNNKMLSIYTI